MFQYVIKLWIEDYPERERFLEVFGVTYRGLCTKDDHDEYCSKLEVMTFDQATLYAPMVMITVVFLPALIYILFCSLRVFGSKNLLRGFLQNPVIFIFPLWTSFSFFGNKSRIRNEPIIAKRANEKVVDDKKDGCHFSRVRAFKSNRCPSTEYLRINIDSLPSTSTRSSSFILPTPTTRGSVATFLSNEAEDAKYTRMLGDVYSIPERRKRSNSFPFTKKAISYSSQHINGLSRAHSENQLKMEFKNLETDLQIYRFKDLLFDPNFSSKQSNILYALFLYGAFSYLLGDLYFTYFRLGVLNFWALPKIYMAILACNILLWLDLKRNFVSPPPANLSRSCLSLTLEDVVKDSSHTLFCLILLPILLLKDVMR